MSPARPKPALALPPQRVRWPRRPSGLVYDGRSADGEVSLRVVKHSRLWARGEARILVRLGRHWSIARLSHLSEPVFAGALVSVIFCDSVARHYDELVSGLGVDPVGALSLVIREAWPTVLISAELRRAAEFGLPEGRLPIRRVVGDVG